MTPEEAQDTFRYDPETGEVYWKERKQGRKFGPIGTHDRDGYLVIWMNERKNRYPVHRIAWVIARGKWPDDQIDHINGVKDDNRLSNLREATNAENMRNVGKQSHNTSGLKGVSWHKRTKKWRADIKENGKRIWLGLYDCPAAASFLYQINADKIHGKFARPF